MGHRKCDDFVFACKLIATTMILPFGAQFHAEHRLFVWRPRGLLDEAAVSNVVAALNQLEMELREPLIDSAMQRQSSKLISITSMLLA